MRKRSFLKKMIGCCVIASVVSPLAGCGESSDVETFKIWTDSSTPLEEEQVTEFNETIGKENGIKIELTNYGSDYSKTVEMAFANGSAPDFYKAQGALSAQVEKGNLFPVNELPDMEEFLSEYEDLLVENTHMMDDKVYSVPGRRVIYGMLYNKDLFEKAGIVDEEGNAKPPKTWDEVLEYAKKMTNPNEDTYGIILPMKWTAFWNTEIMKSIAPLYGRNAYDREADRYDYSIYKDMLEVIMQIKSDGIYFPGSEGLDNDAARAQFATGRVAMKMGASWDVYVLNDQFPAECNWGVCPIPKMNLDDPDYYQNSSTEALINVSSAVKDKDLNKVSLIFKWFYGDERIGELYENALLIPAKSSIIDKYSVKVDKQGQADFGEMAKISDYAEPAWVTIQYEGESMATILDKVWAEMITIDDAIKQLNDGYNEAYQKRITSGDVDMEKYYSVPMERFDRTLPVEKKESCRLFEGN